MNDHPGSWGDHSAAGRILISFITKCGSNDWLLCMASTRLRSAGYEQTSVSLHFRKEFRKSAVSCPKIGAFETRGSLFPLTVLTLERFNAPDEMNLIRVDVVPALHAFKHSSWGRRRLFLLRDRELELIETLPADRGPKQLICYLARIPR